MTRAPSRRPRPRPVRGAITLVAALLVAVASTSCASTEAAPPATTAPPATEAPTTTTEVPPDGGKHLYEYRPEVGDCFDQRTEEDEKNKKQVPYYLLLDCALPHESEVFAVTTYRDPTTTDLKNAPYPGDEAFRDFGKRTCPAAFADYVGLEFEQSVWIMSYVVPSADDWPRDTTVACTVQHPVEKRFSGTARGSKR